MAKTILEMSNKLPWRKPGLQIFGSLEHVQQRISSIQRRIAIYSNNQKLCPSPDNNEALEAYSQELCRLQKKYTIFLKLHSYARTGL